MLYVLHTCLMFLRSAWSFFLEPFVLECIIVELITDTLKWKFIFIQDLLYFVVQGQASLLPKLLKSLTGYSIIAVSKHNFQPVNTCQVNCRANNNKVVFGVMIVDLIRNSCTFSYDFFSFFYTRFWTGK